MNRQRGFGPDSAAIQSLRAADPVMARLIDRLEPIDLATWRARWSLESFGSLARSIVGQQIATPAATAIFGRLQISSATAIRLSPSAVDPMPSSARSACRPPRLRRCGTWRRAHSTAASTLTGWAS